LSFQAAFDARVLASVCFFATDIHSATLGKGKADDTLARVREGHLSGKGELVVSAALQNLAIVSSFVDDIWQAGTG
jgi:hypothetical protein